jgi:hypothetical protein
MEEKKEKKSRGISSLMGEAFLGSILKKLTPMIKKAKPKLIKYLDGINEETGENTGERIIVIIRSGEDDAIVQVSKRENAKVLYKAPPESQYSVEEWAEKIISGNFTE